MPSGQKLLVISPIIPMNYHRGVLDDNGRFICATSRENITAKNIFSEQSEQHNYPCFGGNGIRGYVTNSNRNGASHITGRGALCGNANLDIGEFYATAHAVVVKHF